MTQAAAKSPERGSVKDTLISITIAFIIAFVFRAFVIEAFVIPTGSMAPTLLGAHMRFRSPQSGADWSVNPWYYASTGPGQHSPLPVQGSAAKPVVVTDPMTGASLRYTSGVPRRSGDRILVLKYLRRFFEPQRFDVVVFKAPHEPQVNYIKRLIGLPGEQLALVDGDVFVREPRADDPAPGEGTWALPGWQIQRKHERAQRAVWQTVFASQYWPLTPGANSFINGRPFQPPWEAGGDWNLRGPSYSYSGKGPTTLAWSNAKWGISDRYAYNETSLGSVATNPVTSLPVPPDKPLFPVSDIRLACGVEPEGSGLEVTAVVRCRGHEFRARIAGTTAALEWGPLGPGEAPPTAWESMGAPAALDAPIEPGRVTNVEFWHVDQALQLWVDGRLVAHAEYDWTPPERIHNATGRSLEELLRSRPEGNPLREPGLYLARRAQPRWEFSGGPLRLHRVEVSRDIHYQPGEYGPGLPDGRESPLAGRPSLGTHPASTPTLGPEQHLCCGDNSPFSADSRLWATVDAWVQETIGENMPGIVPRKLMIGKAFFVYFPSLVKGNGVPMVDFGRLRWIW